MKRQTAAQMPAWGTTLPQEQARIRAAIVKHLGQAIKHADKAFEHTCYNHLLRAGKSCHAALGAVVRARLALKRLGRMR